MTTQERAKLKSFATNLKDLVYIGKDGLTENIVEQINLNLYAHELIKVKVQKGAEDDIKVLADAISKSCNCEIVAIIGSKILLYKVTEKPQFIHLLGKNN